MKINPKYELMITAILLLMIVVGTAITTNIVVRTDNDNVLEWANFLDYSPKSKPNVEIVYENLTEEEIAFSKNLTDSLDREYTEKVEKIIFTKTFPEKYEGNYGLEYYSSKVIYINWKYLGSRKYKNIEEQVKVTLCHELLHFYIPVPSSIDYSNVEHKIIENAAQKGVCYTKGDIIY